MYLQLDNCLYGSSAQINLEYELQQSVCFYLQNLYVKYVEEKLSFSLFIFLIMVAILL